VPAPNRQPSNAQNPSHGPCPVAAAGGGPYRPGRGLDRFVRRRDRTCTAIGCRRPAARCDLDHLIRHPDGPTCACNLHPLCRRHHRMKHSSGATVTRRTTGHTVWTMPTGHTYTTPPPAALPTARARPSRTPDTDPDPVAAAPPHWDSAAHGLATLQAAIDNASRPPATEALTDRYDGPPPF
jgi:hypothetical protein